MVINDSVNRNQGRPRQFQDVDAFAAMAAVLAESGLHNLTLGRIAARLGCTSQALIRRFGGRRELELAYLTWVTDVSAARYEAVRARIASPLEAFRAGYVSPESSGHSDTAGPAGYANLLAFQVEAGLDPALREELARRKHVYHENLAESVRAAIAAGEMEPCDPDDIAFLLLTAGSGALMQWIADPNGSLREQIARVFDTVVGPHVSKR